MSDMAVVDHITYSQHAREHVALVSVTEEQARYISELFPREDRAASEWESIADALESRNRERSSWARR